MSLSAGRAGYLSLAVWPARQVRNAAKFGLAQFTDWRAFRATLMRSFLQMGTNRPRPNCMTRNKYWGWEDVFIG